MMSSFAVLDAADPVQKQHWLGQWNGSPLREVAAHPDYVQLFAGSDDKSLCATFEYAGAQVLYPFIMRPVDNPDGDPLMDIVTPYGYGGPFVWGTNDSKRIAVQFWTLFDKWAMQNAVVTEFIRFGLQSDDFLPYPGGQINRLNNYVVPLSRSEDDLWSGFEHKVRKNVKRAIASGITVEIDDTGERFDDFYRIYLSTMDRRDAAEVFYFTREFFSSIHARLSGMYAYFYAVRGGEVISTELVLISAENVYSFLGGTDADSFANRPNDLLKFEIIKWAKRIGKTRFVLGGGAAAGDGIEKYKKAFAPDGAHQFRTGQRVLAPETNHQLVTLRKLEFLAAGLEWPESSPFFPQYRISR